MRLVRFGSHGDERPGIVGGDGQIRDLSSIVDDIGGANLAPRGLEAIATVDLRTLAIVGESERLGPCVAGVGKFICIGLNYADHAEESGMEVPEEPVIFMKATSALSGPNDAIIKPVGSTKLDWEVELGIVIGSDCAYVEEQHALDVVAGFCVVNDLSERAFQLERGGQWDKGKGCDSFGPIGPWLVTKDEIADFNELDLWLDVNDEPRQRGNTRTMIFGVNYIVSYVSQFMSLQPGDIISSGTPPGVGLGMNPPVYLGVGDTVRLGIESLGEQKQRVVSHEQSADRIGSTYVGFGRGQRLQQKNV